MKTKGLVWGAACAFSWAFAPACFAANENSDSGNAEQTAAAACKTHEVACPDCADYCDDCDDAVRSGYWLAGVEFTFLDVNSVTGGLTTVTFNDSTTPGVDYTFRDGNAVQGMAYAPRIWLGRQFGEKWGVVARYWHLESYQDQEPMPPAGTTNLPNFITDLDENTLQLQTIDIEGVRSFTPGKWKVDAMVGARHATFDIESKYSAFGVFTTGNFVNLSLSQFNGFDGTGLTYGLTGRRQIGESATYFFISGRGSNLSGLSDSRGRSAGSIADSPSAPLIGAATVTRNNAEADLIIVEFQAGIQFEHSFTCIPANAFCRVALEYQNWDLQTLPTGGAGFGGTIGNLTTNSFSAATTATNAGGDVDLVGVSISTGLTW